VHLDRLAAFVPAMLVITVSACQIIHNANFCNSVCRFAAFTVPFNIPMPAFTTHSHVLPLIIEPVEATSDFFTVQKCW
jgi:hypothetical protein